MICAGATGGDYLKVIVQRNFFDKENNLVLRTVGEELEVSKKRAAYLLNLKWVKVAENQKNNSLDPPEKTKD